MDCHRFTISSIHPFFSGIVHNDFSHSFEKAVPPYIAGQLPPVPTLQFRHSGVLYALMYGQQSRHQESVPHMKSLARFPEVPEPYPENKHNHCCSYTRSNGTTHLETFTESSGLIKRMVSGISFGAGRRDNASAFSSSEI